MSGAERVRETARLMRERANAARADRWYSDGSDVLSAWSRLVPIATCDGSAVPEGNHKNAEHIASLDPEVARRIADLLDALASKEWCCEECKYDPSNENLEHLATLAVADAYLGAES